MNGKNARNPYAATAKANVCTSALVRNLAPGMACRLNRLNFPVAGTVAMLFRQYAASQCKQEVAVCFHRQIVCHRERSERPVFSGNRQLATGDCFSPCQYPEFLNMMTSR